MLPVFPLLAFASLAFALLPHVGLFPRPLVPALSAPDSLAFNGFRLPHTDEEHPPLNTAYYLHQYIDHNDIILGSFKQRYWVSWEFYKPGALVIEALIPKLCLMSCVFHF